MPWSSNGFPPPPLCDWSGAPDGAFLRVGSLLATTRRAKACDRDSSGHRVGQRGGDHELLRRTSP